MNNRLQLPHRSGFSLIGLVITLGCIGVLMAIMLPSLQGVMSKSPGQARSTMSRFQDGHNLSQIFQVLAFDGILDDRPSFPIPSEDIRGDVSRNTTANVWAAIVAKGVPAQMLVARSEQNPNVEVFTSGQFVADLDRKSNVSFAHMPLYGERFERHWKRLDNLSSIAGISDGGESLDITICRLD